METARGDENVQEPRHSDSSPKKASMSTLDRTETVVPSAQMVAAAPFGRSPTWRSTETTRRVPWPALLPSGNTERSVCTLGVDEKAGDTDVRSASTTSRHSQPAVLPGGTALGGYRSHRRRGQG